MLMQDGIALSTWKREKDPVVGSQQRNINTHTQQEIAKVWTAEVDNITNAFPIKQ